MFRQMTLLTTTAAVCGIWSLFDAQPARAAELLFYSSIPRNITEPLVKAFQAKNPGTKVTMFQSGSEALLDKMELEIMGKGKPNADVIWIQDETSMVRFAAAGLLEKYTPKDADKIPEIYRDKGGTYYGTFITYAVLMYNSKAVTGNAVPKSWLDLADPRFNNLTVFADPSVSGTGVAIASAMVQNFGWSYWEKMAKNKPMITGGHNAMVSLIIAGERTVAPMINHLIVLSMEKAQPVGFVIPREGALAVACYVAVVKGAKAPAEARAFVDYFVSKDAAVIMQKNSMYHSRIDADPPKGWPQIGDIKVLPMDWVRHGKEKDAIKQKFSKLVSQ